jgi:hypothetical protein
VQYDDGDIEDYSADELRNILLDSNGKLSPNGIPEQRHSPRLRKTYMAEIVVDPTEPDQFLHPKDPTAYANTVRHNFASAKYRISYAATKVRTSDNPTITQAKRSNAWPEWRKAIHAEFVNLTSKTTYEIVQYSDIPQDAQVIHTKMDLKVKYDSLGDFIKHKARLVILGNLEAEDGRNDYAATANHKATGLLLALAAKYNLDLTGCDIEGAFLTANIDEEIYIALPRGLEEFPNDKPVYARLKKSMYGLRRSPQLFQNELYAHLKSHGYIQSAHDQSMFHKRTKDDPSEFIVFVTHVDDFAIAASTPQLRHELFECIRLKYTIEDNNLEHFLGINIEYRVIGSTRYLCQSQPMHLQKLFKLCGLDENTDTTKCPQTPMATAYSSTHKDSPPCDRDEYRRVIGSLLYILKTRPDVAFAVNILCTRVATATTWDRQALQRVIRYLYGTQDLVLRYPVMSHDHRITACTLFAYCDYTYP